VNDQPTTTIYVYLRDEGTDVWRPIEAVRLGDDRYQIVSINQSPEDEHWEFTSGDIVRCKLRLLSKGEALVAYELVERSA
jgi:hypothetical protein